MGRRKYNKMIQSIWGWHVPQDFFFTATILENIIAKNKDSIDFNFLEIGVYHGRSFVPMFHYFYDKIKTFYACDVFLDPDQINIFNGHLAKFLPNGYNTKMESITEDSLNLSTHFPLGENSKRFIYCSIDGHHTYEHTINDLRFCAERLEEGGIILLDDVYQFNWPEVGNAMYDFLCENKQFKAAFILNNKVILSRDRDIVEDLYNPTNFHRQKINGDIVNVAQFAPPKGLKGAFLSLYDFILRKPRF